MMLGHNQFQGLYSCSVRGLVPWEPDRNVRGGWKSIAVIGCIAGQGLEGGGGV
jgi:hypothetical protein